MRALLIKTEGHNEVIDIRKNHFLEDCYKAIDTDIIEIVSATIDGIEVDIIIDEEGLLKQDPIFTVRMPKNNIYLAGNAIILPNDLDDEGNYKRGLTQIEVIKIRKFIGTWANFKLGVVHEVLEI